MYKAGELLQYHVQDMNKWEMFANYIFAKVTSFVKFAKFCLTIISKYTARWYRKMDVISILILKM